MPNPALVRLLRKIDPDLVEKLQKLPLSQLNSLLLEVFRLKAGSLTPSDLMEAFRTNRFIKPSLLDPIESLRDELTLLQLAVVHGFRVEELSPLAPLGSCAVIAPVNQYKVVSALRGTEVVADATNVLALLSASARIHAGFDHHQLHYAACHRHLRAQAISNQGHTPHFKVFCAVSAGRDTGGFSFESQAIKKHLGFYRDYFVGKLKLEGVRIIFKSIQEKGSRNALSEALKDVFASSGISIEWQEVRPDDHRYYDGLRFSIDLMYNGKEYNIGDGGFVGWAFKLTGNKKERMLTSGIGTELLFKILRGKV